MALPAVCCCLLMWPDSLPVYHLTRSCDGSLPHRVLPAACGEASGGSAHLPQEDRAQRQCGEWAGVVPRSVAVSVMGFSGPR